MKKKISVEEYNAKMNALLNSNLPFPEVLFAAVNEASKYSIKKQKRKRK